MNMQHRLGCCTLFSFSFFFPIVVVAGEVPKIEVTLPPVSGMWLRPGLHCVFILRSLSSPNHCLLLLLLLLLFLFFLFLLLLLLFLLLLLLPFFCFFFCFCFFSFFSLFLSTFFSFFRFFCFVLFLFCFCFFVLFCFCFFAVFLLSYVPSVRLFPFSFFFSSSALISFPLFQHIFYFSV